MARTLADMSIIRERPIVAIDGPAGAGKSTVARRLAERLGYVYIDTGAMYRAVALAAKRRGVRYDDPERLTEIARELALEFVPSEGGARLLAGGDDVSGAIRTADMGPAASEVSQWPGVRVALVAQQQRMGVAGGVVMEGRDIGTVVFPEAELKIFLTANVDERARRRYEELRARGEPVTLERVMGDVVDRDRRDSQREHSPLRQADDAVEFPTDGLTIEEVVDALAELAHQRERR